MTRTNIKDLAKQRFIAVPKLLLYGKQYKHLSGNAFKTYTALYDRFTLSVQNNWIDEDNNVYFVFDLIELQEITHLKDKGLRNARNELKACGLLEEISTGRNNRLYLSLPTPADDDEAEYIITDTPPTNLKDTSVWSETEKEKVSTTMKYNQNHSKTDDTAKRSIISKSPSNQRERQTILPKEVSDTAKRSTNDTELNETKHKDIKDNKDLNADEQNTLIENSFNNQDPNQEQDLIDQYIENHSLDLAFGEQTLTLVKQYSFGNYQQFKVYSDKFVYALRSVEKDMNRTINPYDKAMLHDALAKTFKKVILQYKTGKIKKDTNNYLFIAIKNVFKDFAQFEVYKETNPSQEIEVPLTNWLEDE